MCAQLNQQGHAVSRLVRREPTAANEIHWQPAVNPAANSAANLTANPAGQQLEAGALEGFDAVVHLGGAGIGDKRWSTARKQEIHTSRIASTQLLAGTLARLSSPPKLYLNCSAVGFYGDQGDTTLDETSAPVAAQQASFLTQLCSEWEAATEPATQAGIATINLRLGVVLSRQAPFLKRQLPLFKLGLGGRLGSADRWVSWISLDDAVGAIAWLLDNAPAKGISGPVNLCSPEPVRNSELTKALGQALRRPAWLPVPKLGPALLLGQELVDCLTESTRVVPQALLSHGYQFKHPGIAEGLRAALAKAN